MERIKRNMGSIMTLSSITFMLLGHCSSNIAFMIIGAYGFVKCMTDISRAIKAGIDEDAELRRMEAYAIKKEADTKAELIAKAYEDGRIRDEDIAYIVRSLAKSDTTTVINANPISRTITASNPQQHVIDVNVTPVEEESETITNTSVEQSTDNSQDDIIHYTIEGGRFKFNYKGNAIAFGPADIIKGSSLHEDFADSFGYYKNGEAVFYIYPVDKTIAVVPL